MKHIKDYIHFYLGCEVELDNSGSKVIKKLIAVGGVDDGEYQYCKLRLGSPEKGFVHSLFLKENRIKLILRPLTDMNDEEAAKSMLGTICRDLGMFNRDWSPKQFAYLLSCGFDLFGLINSGLAIDKTKIK